MISKDKRRENSGFLITLRILMLFSYCLMTPTNNTILTDDYSQANFRNAICFSIFKHTYAHPIEILTCLIISVSCRQAGSTLGEVRLPNTVSRLAAGHWTSRYVREIPSRVLAHPPQHQLPLPQPGVWASCGTHVKLCQAKNWLCSTKKFRTGKASL